MTTLFTWTALCLAAIPIGRVLARRPVWVEAAGRPVVIGCLVTLAVVGAGLVVTAVGRLPLLAPVLAGAALLGAFLAWLRARPSWGRGRRLPPGSLGVAESLDAISEPDYYAEAARRWGPVFKMAQFHRPVVCVTDLPLGLRVLNEQRDRMRQPRLPFGRLSPGNYIEFMNDERHERYRGILSSALNGRLVSECRDGAAAVVSRELQRMAEASGEQGVSPVRFLERIGFVALLRVMAGVGVDDDRLDELEAWFVELGTPRAFVERRPEHRVEPFGRLTAWMRAAGEEVLARRETGGTSPSVLSEILAADPRHLDDDTILGNLVLLVLVTRSNVRGVLGWILKELVDHPAYGEELRMAAALPDGGYESRVRATRFVNEVLRMHQSEYFYREVVRELDVGDYRVPSGWLLRVCVREAHDDPRVFPEPHVFRPERFADRSYDRTEFCPFSDGAHSCFGAGLALMISRVFLTEAATAFDVRRVADGPVERAGNRHWGHWQPNRAFRVSVRPRATSVGGGAD
jgi:cytochrome P450